ncbi:MAG TPA: FecR domain-containing protein [bacterium]|nr:FecR domain-containing protein [bacterium]
MLRKVFLGLSIVVMCGMIFSGVSFAGSGAVLKSFEGDVTVKAAGSDKWAPATANMTLNSGDEIQTKTGTAEVEYADKSVLKIKNDTLTTLSVIKDEKSGQLTRKIKLIMGDMWAQITPGTPTKTEFETPSAVAAVKGTILSLSVDANGVAQIATTEGMVTLAMGSTYTVNLGDGQSVQVTANPDGGYTISSIAGDVTVNVADGSTVEINAGSGFKGDEGGASINVISGTATVTPKDGEPQTVQAGNGVNVSGTGVVTPQEPNSGQADSENNSGKDVNPSNNAIVDPYVASTVEEQKKVGTNDISQSKP